MFKSNVLAVLWCFLVICVLQVLSIFAATSNLEQTQIFIQEKFEEYKYENYNAMDSIIKESVKDASDYYSWQEKLVDVERTLYNSGFSTVNENVIIIDYNKYKKWLNGNTNIK